MTWILRPFHSRRHVWTACRPLAIGAAAVLTLVLNSSGLEGLSASAAGRPAQHAASTEEPTPAQNLLAYQRSSRGWDLAALSEPAPSSTTWRSVRVNGVTRRYLMSLPAGRPTAPLVVALHGLDQRAADFAVRTGLVGATRERGEALVVPESDGPAFNDGRLGPSGPADDEFVLAVIKQLTSEGVVDPQRVTVAGFSNGAGLAMQVAARFPASFSAVVSVDGEMIRRGRGAAIRPRGPVPLILIHGTADPIQPWGGRSSKGITWPAYLSVRESVRVWVLANHVGRLSHAHIPAPSDLSQHAVYVSCWAPGPTGAGVTLYAVKGMGHDWPGPQSDTNTQTTIPIDATAMVANTAASAVRLSTGLHLGEHLGCT